MSITETDVKNLEKNNSFGNNTFKKIQIDTTIKETKKTLYPRYNKSDQ